MKIKFSVTIELDEKTLPYLSKKVIREEIEGCLSSYAQHAETEVKNLLADMNAMEANRNEAAETAKNLYNAAK